MLLLHGLLVTPRVLAGLATRLRWSGFCCHGVDLGGLFGRFNARPIEEIARVVAERVERLVRDHGGDRIDLVGHSEGGLIGRYYVQRLNGARRVRHLVTLGTPHRGTPWAYTGYLFGPMVPSLWQMAPGSNLLRELTDESFPESVRMTSIYSRRDAFCPPSSCRLERRQQTGLKNIELPRGGHLSFLSSGRISSVVCRELGSVEPSGSVRSRFDRAASHYPLVAAGFDEPTSEAHAA